MNEKKYLTLINGEDNDAALDVFCLVFLAGLLRWLLWLLRLAGLHCWVVKARTDLCGEGQVPIKLCEGTLTRDALEENLQNLDKIFYRI